MNKVLIAVVGFSVFMIGHKAYTHYHLWLPAHMEFKKALEKGDLTRAASFIDREQKYEMYGLDPFWFIDGSEK